MFPNCSLFAPHCQAHMGAQMNSKHIRTAVDLARFGAGLKIECGACGNTQTLDGIEVARRCGVKDFRRIQPRLKCSRCGAKQAKLGILPPP